jgi:GNAT superfamily N-acetyltransferase
VIRAATPADAPAWAALELRAWQRAYADFIAAEDMPGVARREARWRERGPAGAYVFVVDERIVGVLRVQPSEAEDGGGELRTLYVEPAAQGAGIGGRLHDHGLDALRDAGFAEATLWTFSANAQARDFYAARGWRPDGPTGVWLGAQGLRLRRDLQDR